MDPFVTEICQATIREILKICNGPYPQRLVLNSTPGFSVTSGDRILNLESVHTKYLCVQFWLILHFEVNISVITDFPVNWPQCQRPWKHPIFEGVFFAKLSLLRRLPLEGCLRFQHNLFQFLRTERVEWWRRTESEFLLGLEVEFEGFFGELEKSRLVLSQTSLRSQIKFCIERTIFKITFCFAISSICVGC